MAEGAAVVSARPAPRGARVRHLFLLHAASSALCGAAGGLWGAMTGSGGFSSLWVSFAQIAFGLGFVLVALLAAATAWPRSDDAWRVWRWLAPAAAPLAVSLFLLVATQTS